MELFASAALSIFISSPEASNDNTQLSTVRTKRSPSSPDVQFLFLSPRLSGIRATNYCRALSETKTDSGYKQRPLNALKELIHRYLL